jgi:hypothetical protein
MNKKQKFIQEINEGYLSKGDSIILGGAILDGEPLSDTFVKIPLNYPGSLRAAFFLRNSSTNDGY